MIVYQSLGRGKSEVVGGVMPVTANLPGLGKRQKNPDESIPEIVVPLRFFFTIAFHPCGLPMIPMHLKSSSFYRFSCLIVMLCLFAPQFSLVASPMIDRIVRSEDGLFNLTFFGRKDHHYLLFRSVELDSLGSPVGIWSGENAFLTVKDRLYPGSDQLFYRMREIPNGEAGDVDGDGIDDYQELTDVNIFQPDKPPLNVFNPVRDLSPEDGRFRLTREEFDLFSVAGDGTRQGGGGHQRFLKFLTLNHHDRRAVLFSNSTRHGSHASLLTILPSKYEIHGEVSWRGEIVFDQNRRGGKGLFLFQFQQNDAPPFTDIQAIYELLTMNMPFIEGNLTYRPFEVGLSLYHRQVELYKREGIPVLLPSGFEVSPDSVSLNLGKTYGLLRVIEEGERPSIFDVAIFKQLPNDVPLLRGIVTEVPQTPLSHVNLRAVQNDNPNIYVRDATTHPQIEPLIGKYVEFTVTAGGFHIREATKKEVDLHLDSLRPSRSQSPGRNFLVDRILPLVLMGHGSAPAFGVKASNLAELRKLDGRGLPNTAVPDGFGIPFYFYHEFMLHNRLYEEARAMIDASDFQERPEVREQRLAAFRDRVKESVMPEHLLEKLTDLQKLFPEGQSFRFRSSTNNEDLPGFNGAGLYSSFTHHPDEGHISKSVKQVFASLWNFLAFEHREFYRVDHFRAAMGILVHPNFKNEQANGVAVARDILSFTDISRFTGRYYVNVQVGEDLVTNPGLYSQPEEILVDNSSLIRLARSNQVAPGTHVLSDENTRLLYQYLSVINGHFQELVSPPDGRLAMEIEFKVTAEGVLVVKQARPWVD